MPAAPEYATYATKTITPAQRRYADWLTEKTGHPVDLRSVALAMVLRETFKRSGENQAVLRARREELVTEAEQKAAATRELLEHGRPRPEPQQCIDKDNGVRCPTMATAEQPLRKGRCPRHYQRARRNGTLLVPAAEPVAAQPSERRLPKWP
jgi:hypothetical protein